jgi:large subunit ribosomal protein L40
MPLSTLAMSFLLLTLRTRSPPLRLANTSVRYAGRKESASNPKMEILRRVLYPSNIRNRPSPVGTWRPDVGRALQRAIPSVQAHETIERAWLLHQRHIRKKRDAEFAKKFECMKNAMAELEVVDPRSFKEANRTEDPRTRSAAETELTKKLRGPEKRAVEARIRGLFPREMRPPPDTPSRDGWDYNWKPILPAQQNSSCTCDITALCDSNSRAFLQNTLTLTLVITPHKVRHYPKNCVVQSWISRQ